MTVIVSENREGWIYAFFSVWNNRGIPVPVDASSQPDDIAYILSDCQPSCIWTTTGKRDLVDRAQQIAGTDIQVHIIDNYEREPLADATPSEQSWEREVRLSNYLLWQAAYTELYFCDTYWPDFDADALHKAIISYQSRQRRFGKTEAQIEKETI